MSSLSDLTVFNIARCEPKIEPTASVVPFYELAEEVGASKTIGKEKIEIKRSICDLFVSKNLEAFLIPHPQMLIDFISKSNSHLDFYEFQRNMKSLLLSPCHEDPKSALDCIAENFGISVDDMIKKVKFSFENLEKYKKEWNKENAKIKINENTIEQINKNWELKTINDLYKLHSVACSMDLKLFLLVSISASEDENDESEQFVYTTVIGNVSNPKHSCYLYCHSYDKFYLLQTLVSKKEKEVNNEMKEAIERITLPGKVTLNYLSYAKIAAEVTEKTKCFSNVSFQQEIREDAKNPSLEFSNSADSLIVKLIVPNDSLGTGQLIELFTKLGASKPEKKEEKQAPFLPENTKLVFNGGKTFAIQEQKNTHDVKVDNLKQITSDRSLREFSWLCDNVNVPVVSGSSALSEFQVLRLVNGLSNSTKTFESSFKQHPPYIASRVPSIPLSKAAKNPYSELLCLESILHAGANSQSICCKYCHKNRRAKENKYMVMYPMRRENKVFVKWICKNCFAQQSDKMQKEIVGMFPAFHSALASIRDTQDDEVRLAALNSAAERVHLSIMNLRSQPIGSLRTLVPKIDAAYEELISILKLFRQRMLQMKKVTAKDITSIRNKEEYYARVGKNQRIVMLPEPDEEVIDYKLFSEYLSSYTNETEDTTQYLLTLPLKEVKEKLINETKEFLKQEAENEKEKKIQEISFDTPDFGVGELDFSVEYTAEDVTCKPFEENVYSVSFIEAGAFVTSPIAKLKTTKTLKAFSLYKEGRMIVVLHDKRSKEGTIHICPLCNSRPDNFASIFTLHDVNECEVSISEEHDIAVLNKETGEVTIVYFEDEESEEISSCKVECEASIRAIFIAWMNETLYISGEKQYYTYKLDGETSEINDIDTTLIGDVCSLVSSQTDVIAIDKEGKAISLVNNAFYSSVSPNSCFSSLNGKNGILSIAKEGTSFTKLEEKKVLSIKSMSIGKTNRFMTDKCILGLEKSKLISPQRFAFAFSNLIPSLSAFFYENMYYPITSDLKVHSKVPESSIYTTASNNFFNDVFTNLSLHSTEESLLSFDHEASVVCFITTPGSHKESAAFVDSIFGTSFETSTPIDGIYVASRISNKRQFVVMFIRNSTTSECIYNQVSSLHLAKIPSFLVSSSPCECTDLLAPIAKDKLKLLKVVIIIKDSNDVSRHSLDAIEKIVNSDDEQKIPVLVEFSTKQQKQSSKSERDQNWKELIYSLEKKSAKDTITQSKRFISYVSTLTIFGESSLSCITAEEK